ncbi:MAG: acylneuraminate cytidylyltransferase [Cytophagia bacterium]|nr:MAG: acylneuraminate cytidylyltransferase [Runella sp.]TAG21155.1 MAG: acylneuraminate cytidylyltransferase [Cytophagales bacterium]TAG40259.1 MAG: acylneuraminate cytidylyltransferase [Cytophagia bacterium]TAG52991.1 MAG: acylneuraminate cytidylyltransferase [Runella slithyformis]TAG65699.1 MAG: acylneuraminate cytidylyltransferase [Runella slithyformis]
MRTIAFIPVRCGSKSIPFKNIKLFCGKPLIYWPLRALEDCEAIDQVVVATDCEAIARVVQDFNLKKTTVYRRLAENATDTASTESVMLEYIAAATPQLQLSDVMVLVQATSPLTQTQHFEEALMQYQSEHLDAMLSCVNTKRFIWNKNGTPQNYDFYKRPRRQDFEGDWVENGAFYIHTVGGILKHQCRLGGKVGIYEMPEYTFVELDEPHDWITAELLMQQQLKQEVVLTNFKNVKIFLTDVDGVLTDGSMYYTENGDEFKRFHTHDGMAFELLRNAGIKTGIITSEQTDMVARRAAKLKVDYLFQGKRNGGKLAAAQEICQQEGVKLSEIAYVGDDVNCLELLQAVGVAACPANAVAAIKNIPNVLWLTKKGGDGAVREFAELILEAQ